MSSYAAGEGYLVSIQRFSFHASPLIQAAVATQLALFWSLSR